MRARIAMQVENLVRQTRNGKLNESDYTKRMVGTGEIADHIHSLFQLFRHKYGFENLPALDASRFKPPLSQSRQLRLF